MLLAASLFALSITHRAAAPPPAPSIAWPDFFSRVSTEGLVYSEKLRALEGRRVRLRGFAVTNPPVPGGLIMTRDPYSDPHDVDETDVPYDAVGVLWRKGLAITAVPGRPTVEGTVRLGNHEVGSQIVAILLEDAVPAPPRRKP